MILIGLAMLTSKAISQSNTHDSVTCLKNSQLRSVIKDLEKGKICKEEVVILNNSVRILESRISKKDSIIQGYKDKSILKDSLILRLEDNIIKQSEIISIDTKMIKTYKNKLKINKALRWGFGLAGFVIGFLIGK